MVDNSSKKPTKRKKVTLVVAATTVLADGKVIAGHREMKDSQQESPRNTTRTPLSERNIFFNPSAPSVEQMAPAFREEIRAMLAESLAEIRAMPVLSLEKTCPMAVTSRSSPVKEHSTVHLVSETDSDPEEPESFTVDEVAIDNLFREEEGEHEAMGK